MREYLKFYINGRWVDPSTPRTLAVIDPATQRVAGRISLGSAADVDLAVAAARRAFESFSQTSRPERLQLLRRVLQENMINGDGPTVGAAIARHRGIDMVSFTGSTRAGIEVAKNAADTVKRVQQELGGKSPYIVLPDADLELSVAAGVRTVMLNSGQSCNAPTRLLVPSSKLEDAIRVARSAAEGLRVGNPLDENVQIGPVVSELHWTRIQDLIQRGLEEGAMLVTGGPGKPMGLETGYYVKPTVFARVRNDMAIAREEIFGPVIVIIGYDSIDEAIAIANDTDYGLAAYVQGADLATARRVATRLRAGQVTLNGAPPDFMAPFGGYKQSGNGREWGDHALAEFLETKAVLGYGDGE